MTSYAPDLAPETEPRVVRWQPTHPVGGPRAHLLTPWAAVALGAVAAGALALSVVAVQALASGRLYGGRRRFPVLKMDALNVARLRRRPF